MDYTQIPETHRDLARAVEAFRAKIPERKRLWKYYDGDHPVIYSAKNLQDLFERYEIKFYSQNWCAVVVDAATERLKIESFDAGTPQANEAAAELWDSTDMDLDADTVHEAACVTGESYVLVWDVDSEPTATYVDPAQGHVHYDAERPNVPAWGARTWTGDDGHIYVQVLYPDRADLWRLTSKSPTLPDRFSAEAWTWDEDGSGPHTIGEVPLYHFRRQRRGVRGDLHAVTGIQDQLNQTLSNMMVAGDFDSIQMRYVVTNAKLDNVKRKPGGILRIPAGDGESEETQVGTFPGSGVDVFLSPINHDIAAIAAISRTPRHYFTGSTSTPSGEALMAMEAPLIRRVTDCQMRFGATWARVVAALLRLRGLVVNVSDIQPVWQPAETVQPTARAQTRLTNTQAGMPLRTILRDEGWSADELAQMDSDRVEDEAAALQAQVTPAEVMNANAQALVDALTAAVESRVAAQ